MPGNGHKTDCQCHICIPKGRRHGGHLRYLDGCRCAICVDGARQRWRTNYDHLRSDQRKYKLRSVRARNHKLRKHVRHGTTTGYRNGCRCWDCLEAMNIYQRVRNGGTAPSKRGAYKVIRSTNGGNLK